MRLYIVVKDIVPDHMVPVLVAHTVMNADHSFSANAHFDSQSRYMNWKNNSFKKCVVSVNEKEWMKIINLDIPVFLGYENTVDEGRVSCAIPLPLDDKDLPNVLKYAKLWKPNI